VQTQNCSSWRSPLIFFNCSICTSIAKTIHKVHNCSFFIWKCLIQHRCKTWLHSVPVRALLVARFLYEHIHARRYIHPETINGSITDENRTYVNITILTENDSFSLPSTLHSRSTVTWCLDSIPPGPKSPWKVKAQQHYIYHLQFLATVGNFSSLLQFLDQYSCYSENSIVSPLKFVDQPNGSRKFGYSQMSSDVQALLLEVGAIYGSITLTCLLEPFSKCRFQFLQWQTFQWFPLLGERSTL
jgi:hypothetical protein